MRQIWDLMVICVAELRAGLSRSLEESNEKVKHLHLLEMDGQRLLKRLAL